MRKSIYSDKATKLQAALVKARAEKSLTQAELAGRLGKPQSFVSYYENGGRRLDVLEFLEICRTLGVDATKIIRTLEN